MISAVVIGKNEGERLQKCLKSIRDALGMLSYEIVYVDSRSTDDSVAVARACGARCFVLTETDTTAGLGRLVGTREAKGDYLLFLDGDMELLPGFVQRAMMDMATKNADAVIGQRADIYLRGGREIGRQANYFSCTQERICPEFGGALFVKREALEKAGGWSGDTIACEEAELHARLRDAGCAVLEIPVPMIVHTDAVRDERGVLSVIFSKRRLGEGQAMRCAMARGKGRAYLRFEREKFRFFALDVLAALLLIVLFPIGVLPLCFIEMMQLGYFLSKKRIRAFVSQKLFFFAFPMGLLTYKKRSDGCEAV